MQRPRRDTLLRGLLLLLLYVVAFAVRHPFASIPAYGDEGGFYYVAKHLDADPPNLHDLYVSHEAHRAANLLYLPTPPIFWYRPAEFLQLWPAAQFGWSAYRLAYVTLTSFAPPLAALFLLRRGVRTTTATMAGGTLAITPYLAVWTTITVPDALMATWFLLGMVAWDRGSGRGAAAAFLMAAWTKETAIPGIAAILFGGYVVRHRWRLGELWPLRPTAKETLLGFTLLLSPGFVVLGTWKGQLAPGGAGHAGLGWLLDGLFLYPWLGLVSLLGVALPKARKLAALGLVYPAFYLSYEALGRFTDIWYLVLPATLCVVGAASTVDAALDSPRPAARSAALAVGVLLILVVVGGAFVPSSDAKARLLRPFDGSAAQDLWQEHRYESSRDADRDHAIATLPSGPGHSIFVVDVYEPEFLYPIVDGGASVYEGETHTVETLGQRLDPWAPTIENVTQLTLLKKSDTALNRAIRDVYADCVRLDDNRYVVIDGHGCPGRGATLERRWDELRS